MRTALLASLAATAVLAQVDPTTTVAPVVVADPVGTVTVPVVKAPETAAYDSCVITQPLYKLDPITLLPSTTINAGLSTKFYNLDAPKACTICTNPAVDLGASYFWCWNKAATMKFSATVSGSTTGNYKLRIKYAQGVVAPIVKPGFSVYVDTEVLPSFVSNTLTGLTEVDPTGSWYAFKEATFPGTKALTAGKHTFTVTTAKNVQVNIMSFTIVPDNTVATTTLPTTVAETTTAAAETTTVAPDTTTEAETTEVPITEEAQVAASPSAVISLTSALAAIAGLSFFFARRD